MVIRVRTLSLLAIAVSLSAGGCIRPVKGLFPPPPLEPTVPVHVVSHGWHTGLVIDRADVPPDLWPEQHDFAQSRHLEIGWGDEGFYRAQEITPGLALRAMFLPTPSVMHVVGFDEPVEGYFQQSKIYRVELGEPAFRQLCRFVADTYDHDSGGQAIPLGPGIYGNSRFYRAKGNYYFPKTCNIWTARALRTAGCPIDTWTTVSAGRVIDQVDDFATHVTPSDTQLAQQSTATLR